MVLRCLSSRTSPGTRKIGRLRAVFVAVSVSIIRPSSLNFHRPSICNFASQRPVAILERIISLESMCSEEAEIESSEGFSVLVSSSGVLTALGDRIVSEPGVSQLISDGVALKIC